MKLTTSTICLDCSAAEYSNLHKLFDCVVFAGPERHYFVQKINEDTGHFEESVIFSEDCEICEAFKTMVDYICNSGFAYDYKIVINR